jgi:hypothetical protein
MERRDGVPEAIGELIGQVIGWAFCMAVAAGAYFIGYGAAGHFGGEQHRDAIGILSAIVVIWMYEHRRANERWQRFLERENG